MIIQQNNNNMFLPRLYALPSHSILVRFIVTSIKFFLWIRLQIKTERNWILYNSQVSIIPVSTLIFACQNCGMQGPVLSKTSDGFCPSSVYIALLALWNLAYREEVFFLVELSPANYRLTYLCLTTTLCNVIMIESYHLIMVGNQVEW